MKRLIQLLLPMCLTLACHGQKVLQLPENVSPELEMSPPGVVPFKIKRGEKSSCLCVGNVMEINLPVNVWITKSCVSKDQKRALLMAQRMDENEAFWNHDMIAVYLEEATGSWRIDHRMTAWQLAQVDTRWRVFFAIKDVENLPIVVFEVGTTSEGGFGKVNYKLERWNIETGQPEPLSN